MFGMENFGERAKNKVFELTFGDMAGIVETVGVIENVYGMDIARIEILLKNQTNDGYGQSTAKLCQNYNININEVFGQLRAKGWINRKNQITEKGIKESNNIEDEFDASIEKLVFQDRLGGLYWDTQHPLFEEKWVSIVDACIEKDSKEFNEILKQSKSPFGTTATELLKNPSSFVVVNGDKLNGED